MLCTLQVKQLRSIRVGWNQLKTNLALAADSLSDNERDLTLVHSTKTDELAHIQAIQESLEHQISELHTRVNHLHLQLTNRGLVNDDLAETVKKLNAKWNRLYATCLQRAGDVAEAVTHWSKFELEKQNVMVELTEVDIQMTKMARGVLPLSDENLEDVGCRLQETERQLQILEDQATELRGRQCFRS